MWRLAAIATAVLVLTTGAAEALEIKNVRSTYGPYGSVRPGNKFQKNDVILLYYDIEGLKVEEASGNVRYSVKLEVFDEAKKSLFDKVTPNQQQIALGGTRVAGFATVVLGDQNAGKYSTKVTVKDEGTKDTATFTYDFVIVDAEFGVIHANLPAYGFINNDYPGAIVVVGMGRDGKKLQNVDVHVRVFDEKGKVTLTKPMSVNIPKDLPEELANKDTAPIPIPLFLTRVGEFRVEIEGVDNVSKKNFKLNFPLKVVDPSAVK